MTVDQVMNHNRKCDTEGCSSLAEYRLMRHVHMKGTYADFLCDKCLRIEYSKPKEEN
jgi:hypothetical protein